LKLLDDLGLETIMFNSREDMNEYVESDDYATPNKRLCFGVIVDKNILTQEYSYSLRFNVSSFENDIPSTTNKFRTDTLYKYYPLILF
jgi:hypothetical protein